MPHAGSRLRPIVQRCLAITLDILLAVHHSIVVMTDHWLSLLINECFCRKRQRWTCSAWIWRPGPGLNCKPSLSHIQLISSAVFWSNDFTVFNSVYFPPVTSHSPVHLWAAPCSPWRPYRITHSSYTEVSAQTETLSVSISKTLHRMYETHGRIEADKCKEWRK